MCNVCVVILSDAGFDGFCETFAAHPNILLCVHYICDVGRIIVTGTEAVVHHPNTHSVSHHHTWYN